MALLTFILVWLSVFIKGHISRTRAEVLAGLRIRYAILPSSAQAPFETGMSYHCDLHKASLTCAYSLCDTGKV